VKIRGERREERVLLSLLRRARQQLGITQTELAGRLGRPQSFVSKYESGERRLDLIELRRVCKALGLPLKDLISRFESEIT
jgi:transcriptional regulator with XRE-family HTH domain